MIIKVCNLKQQKCAAVVTEIKNLAKITALVVDPIIGYLYFYVAYTFLIFVYLTIDLYYLSHIVKLIFVVKKYQEYRYNSITLIKILQKLYHLMLQAFILVSNCLERTRQSNWWDISGELDGRWHEEDYLWECKHRKWNGDWLSKIKIILVGQLSQNYWIIRF